MTRFRAAPWASSLKLVSFLGCAVLAGAGFVTFKLLVAASAAPPVRTVGIAIPILSAAAGLLCALFIVSGYDLEGTTLRVRRPLWRTAVSLAGLHRAFHEPDAMRRSLRVLGNGGLFSITGIYQNKRLGRYRAFVTDPARAVVLVLPKRVVVVSPADPREFMQSLRATFPAMLS